MYTRARIIVSVIVLTGLLPAGAFWEQMTTWIQQDGENTERVLRRIDHAWPKQ